jgi:hypothetical protein
MSTILLTKVRYRWRRRRGRWFLQIIPVEVVVKCPVEHELRLDYSEKAVKRQKRRTK